MTKPSKIIIIRHGESEGNVDHSIYTRIPDHALSLTNTGKDQARSAGLRLEEYLSSFEEKSKSPRGKIRFWLSTYRRAEETLSGIRSTLSSERINPDSSFDVRYAPQLREQEWPRMIGWDREKADKYMTDVNQERDHYGTFHYRFDNGESGADVYTRVENAIFAMQREFSKSSFPEYLVIVGHGFLNRMFVARWYDMSPAEFELLKNPDNCGFYILSKNEKTGKYDLELGPEKHESYKSPFSRIDSFRK